MLSFDKDIHIEPENPLVIALMGENPEEFAAVLTRYKYKV